jgi:hypothetical protein
MLAGTLCVLGLMADVVRATSRVLCGRFMLG